MGVSRKPVSRRKLPLAAAVLGVAVALTPWVGTASAATCDTSWASASSGFWDVAGNWTAGVPSTDKACITLPGTYTVTVRTGVIADGLTLGGSSGTQTLELVASVAFGDASLSLAHQGSGSDGVLAHGRIVLTSTDNGTDDLDVFGTLMNAGTISVETGAGGPRYWDDNVNNTATGSITINAVLSAARIGDWTNSGSLTIAAGAQLPVSGLTLNTAMTNSGSVLVGCCNGLTWNAGTITNSGSFTVSGGNVTTGPASLSGNAINAHDVTISPNGTGTAGFVLGSANTLASDVAANMTLTVQEGAAGFGIASLEFSSNRTNNGTIHLTGTDASTYAQLIGPGATLTNNGTITVDPGGGNGGRYWHGTVVNGKNGSIAMNESLSDAGGPWTSSGMITVAANKTLPLGNGTSGLTLKGGVLGGSGTVQTNVVNTAGTVAPGASAGTLTIDGNYTQGMKAKFNPEVNGAGVGQFDVLAVTGTASLNGKVAIDRLSTFKPGVGTTVGPLLTAASLSGKFSKETGGTIVGKMGTYFDPQYSPTAFSLVVHQVTLSVPASAARGSSPPISGTSWPANEKVTLTFVDVNGANKASVQVTANGSGSFSTSALTIPAGAATGNGKITAKSVLTGTQLKKTINIT